MRHDVTSENRVKTVETCDNRNVDVRPFMIRWSLGQICSLVYMNRSGVRLVKTRVT